MVVSRKGKPRVNKGNDIVHDLGRDHWRNFNSSSRFGVLANDTKGDFDKETNREDLVVVHGLVSHGPINNSTSHTKTPKNGPSTKRNHTHMQSYDLSSNNTGTQEIVNPKS